MNSFMNILTKLTKVISWIKPVKQYNLPTAHISSNQQTTLFDIFKKYKLETWA